MQIKHIKVLRIFYYISPIKNYKIKIALLEKGIQKKKVRHTIVKIFFFRAKFYKVFVKNIIPAENKNPCLYFVFVVIVTIV